MSEFVIGDIHGCARSLRLILDHIDPQPSDTVVLLGDYIDRGPDSCAVLDTVLALNKTTTVVPLQGNHEVMLRNARLDQTHLDEWIVQGGAATLSSYDREGFGRRIDSIPDRHWTFLCEQTLDYWETDDVIYVHATVDPELDLIEQPPFLLFWQPFQNPTVHHSGKPVICGHASQKSGVPATYDLGVCIDTWAHGGGWLTCYDVSRQHIIQANERGQFRMFDLESINEPEGT